MNQQVMKYKTVPINSIRPDPNQPRKLFDKNALEEMSISIKSEGVINAIEVDENLVIITGEQRWRSSKLAGLEEVPIKIIEKLKPKERFIRQMQENIHQNTMSPLETAEGYNKIIQWLSSSTAELVRDKKHQSDRYQKGVKELHELFGKSESSISDYLSLLGETKEVKNALKTRGFQVSKVTSLKWAPDKYKDKLRKIITTQTTIPRDSIRHIIKGLNRAEKYGESDKAEKLLQQNFEGMTIVEVANKVNKIIPDENSRVEEPAGAIKLISEKIVDLMETLERYPLESFDNFHGPILVKDINGLGFYLKTYLQKKRLNGNEKKLLENKK